MGSTGPTTDSLQLAVLGKSGTRPKDDIVSNFRAQIEQACDSLRQQGSSKASTIGLSKVDVCAPTALTESPSCTIAEALLVPKTAIWSTMVMHTSPFKSDILQNVHPHHEVLLSCKPHRPGCHQWRPRQPQVHDDVQDFQPDVIVERYLDAQSTIIMILQSSMTCVIIIAMQRISLNLIRLSQ